VGALPNSLCAEPQFAFEWGARHAGGVPETRFDEWIAPRYARLWPELYDPAVLDPTVDLLADLAGPVRLSGSATRPVPTPNSEAGRRHQLVAPNAIRMQALELLLCAVKGGRVSEQDALALHERMTALKMRLLGDRVSRRAAWNLAREPGWDDLRYAEYLAVTQLQADALVAGDHELARLASDIVALAPTSALVS
jgi:hypothetical protein